MPGLSKSRFSNLLATTMKKSVTLQINIRLADMVELLCPAALYSLSLSLLSMKGITVLSNKQKRLLILPSHAMRNSTLVIPELPGLVKVYDAPVQQIKNSIAHIITDQTGITLGNHGHCELPRPRKSLSTSDEHHQGSKS